MVRQSLLKSMLINMSHSRSAKVSLSQSKPEKVKYTYADAAAAIPESVPVITSKSVPKNTNKVTNHMDVKKNILAEAKKIVGLSPIANADRKYIENSGQLYSKVDCCS